MKENREIFWNEAKNYEQRIIQEADFRKADRGAAEETPSPRTESNEVQFLHVKTERNSNSESSE